MLRESPSSEPEVNEPPATPPCDPNEPPRPLDPTRYGDWVKNGRCIDF